MAVSFAKRPYLPRYLTIFSPHIQSQKVRIEFFFLQKALLRGENFFNVQGKNNKKKQGYSMITLYAVN